METILIVISKEELEALIKKTLIEILITNSVSKAEDKPDEFLNFQEAVEYLKISKPTFAKIRSNFPSYKPSENRVLFKKSDLEAYMESCKMKN
jgi:excisionase family DNA binding protein